MVKLIEYGAIGMAKAEGTEEIPDAVFLGLDAEFPGLVSITKSFRRANEPSLYAMTNDIAKAIGPEHNGHATLCKSKEFRIFMAKQFEKGGMRVKLLLFFQQNNARGPQNDAENSGPAFYALVTLLMPFIDIRTTMAGNTNQLWEAIRTVRKNMLVCAQAAVVYVLWHYVFAPYRAFSTAQNSQADAVPVVEEIYALMRDLVSNPRPINEWPFFAGPSAGHLVQFAADMQGEGRKGHKITEYTKAIAGFCIAPTLELKQAELQAFYTCTKAMIGPYAKGVLEEIDALCGKRYGDLLKMNHMADIAEIIRPPGKNDGWSEPDVGPTAAEADPAPEVDPAPEEPQQDLLLLVQHLPLHKHTQVPIKKKPRKGKDWKPTGTAADTNVRLAVWELVDSVEVWMVSRIVRVTGPMDSPTHELLVEDDRFDAPEDPAEGLWQPRTGTRAGGGGGGGGTRRTLRQS